MTSFIDVSLRWCVSHVFVTCYILNTTTSLNIEYYSVL